MAFRACAEPVARAGTARQIADRILATHGWEADDPLRDRSTLV